MSKLRAIIADDELDAIEVLDNMLCDSGQVEVLAKINKPLRIESQINKLKPDVLFLDIQMKGINGIELLENIREYNQDLPVVFITAYDKYIPEAIKLNVFSYLLKPIDQEELYSLIERILTIKGKNHTQEQHKIKLPVIDGYVYLNSSDIFLLEAEGNYTRIKTIQNDEYISSYNMGKMHEQIGDKEFFRINRGCVLNANYIHFINRKKSTCLVRINGQEFEFNASQSFLSLFNKMQG